MTSESRLNTAWIFSLLLVLALTTSLGHIHCDHMPAKQCAICAFGDQAHISTAIGKPPVDGQITDQALPPVGTTAVRPHPYLSRAPPLA